MMMKLWKNEGERKRFFARRLNRDKKCQAKNITEQPTPLDVQIERLQKEFGNKICDLRANNAHEMHDEYQKFKKKYDRLRRAQNEELSV